MLYILKTGLKHELVHIYQYIAPYNCSTFFLTAYINIRNKYSKYNIYTQYS